MSSPLHTEILILDSVYLKTAVGVQGLLDLLHKRGGAWFGLMFPVEESGSETKPSLQGLALSIHWDNQIPDSRMKLISNSSFCSM